MPDSISSSISRYLNSLKHNLLVIDSSGIIRFASLHWEDFNQLYGFSAATDWRGLNALMLFGEQLANPGEALKLEQLLREVFQWDRLASSTELALLTENRGTRVFRLELVLLITEQTPACQTAMLTLRDISPSSSPGESVIPHSPFRRLSASHQHISPQLVPICASCKSIRNSREEWITVERFLQLQLSLQFTHDICPACIRELYPKYAAALKW